VWKCNSCGQEPCFVACIFLSLREREREKEREREREVGGGYERERARARARARESKNESESEMWTFFLLGLCVHLSHKHVFGSGLVYRSVRVVGQQIDREIAILRAACRGYHMICMC